MQECLNYKLCYLTCEKLAAETCQDLATLNKTGISVLYSAQYSLVQERCDKRRAPLSYPTPLLLYTITLPTASLVRTPYPLLK